MKNYPMVNQLSATGVGKLPTNIHPGYRERKIAFAVLTVKWNGEKPLAHSKMKTTPNGLITRKLSVLGAAMQSNDNSTECAARTNSATTSVTQNTAPRTIMAKIIPVMVPATEYTVKGGQTQRNDGSGGVMSSPAKGAGSHKNNTKKNMGKSYTSTTSPLLKSYRTNRQKPGMMKVTSSHSAQNATSAGKVSN